MDYFGAAGEIAVDNWFTNQGVRSRVVLLARYAPKTPDMNVSGILIEVKSSPAGQRYLHIKKYQYETMEPRPKYYFPVLFDSENTYRFCAPIPYDDVSQWEVWQNKRKEPCYRIDRDRLPLLTDFFKLTSKGAE